MANPLLVGYRLQKYISIRSNLARSCQEDSSATFKAISRYLDPRNDLNDLNKFLVSDRKHLDIEQSLYIQPLKKRYQSFL